MKKIMITCFISITYFLTAWAQVPSTSVPNANIQSPNNSLKESDTSQIIIVSPQQNTFSVILPSNPSTGFSWTLKTYDGRLLQPVGHQYVPPKGLRPGASGYDIWQFQGSSQLVNQPQATTIKMIYQRPWNQEVGQERSFTIESK